MGNAMCGCPILKENGCYDITVNLKTTAGLCMDDCPLPFCVLDYETKQGNSRQDVRVAVLWYSGKTVQEIAKIVGWRLETVRGTLNKWQEREKELVGVA